jgi:hypothetical protein
MFREIILALLILGGEPVKAMVPPNDLAASDGTAWNVSEQNFHDIIQTVYDVYSPIFKDLGVNFWFERNWQSKEVNIYSYKYDSQWTKNWKILVHGGLARRPEMTKEGFTIALCHEIGHLVGGFPFKNYSNFSAEGQAWYYATHVCGKKVFAKMAKKMPLLNKLKVDVEICSKYFDEKVDQDACRLAVFGSKSFADLHYIAMQERRAPDIETVDTYKIGLTNQLWVPSQCILDTLVAGILCEKRWDDKMIPTKKNATCSTRPLCWYKP